MLQPSIWGSNSCGLQNGLLTPAPSSVFDSAPTTLSIPTITEEDLNKTSKPTSCYTTRPLLEETLCLEKVEDKTDQYSQHKRQQYSKDPPQPSKSSQQKASQNQPQPSQRSPQNSSSSSRLERRKSFGLLLAQKVSRLSGSHLKESRPKSTLFESSPTSNTYNTHRQLTAPKSPPRDPESPERFSLSPSTLVGLDVLPKLPYVLENQPSITHIIEPRQKTQIPTFFHARPQLLAFELPVKKDQILKIKIFVTSSSSSTSDVIALKLKKTKTPEHPRVDPGDPVQSWVSARRGGNLRYQALDFFQKPKTQAHTVAAK